jgi:hypothetical protein
LIEEEGEGEEEEEGLTQETLSYVHNHHHHHHQQHNSNTELLPHSKYKYIHFPFVTEKNWSREPALMSVTFPKTINV